MSGHSVLLKKTARAMLLGSLLAIPLLVGCSSSAVSPTPHATTASTFEPLPVATVPRFSEWRAAYADDAGYVHAVTLDGKTDLSIDRVGNFGIHALRLFPATVSHDGHLLAFESKAGVAVHDLTGGLLGQKLFNTYGGVQVLWSPDGTQLILDENQGAKSIMRVSDGRVNTSPPSLSTLGPVLGWVDTSHIALITFASTTAGAETSMTLAIADVANWTLRPVVTMAFASMTGTWRMSLAPDGKHALYYNERYRSDPYVPVVKEIDMASGAMTSLPTLAKAMGPYSGFTSLAWTADGQRIAASTGFDLNNDLKTWVLDLHNDTATELQLSTGRYVAGWDPGSGTLVLTSGGDTVVDAGPFTISAVSLGEGGKVTETVLTNQAYTFPFVGFVRTA